MSFYVNPPNCSKEAWLERRGLEILGKTLDWDTAVAHGIVPVVLIDNGASTSAVIAYRPVILEVATDPLDLRPKRIFLVEIAALLGGVAPEFARWYANNGPIK